MENEERFSESGISLVYVPEGTKIETKHYLSQPCSIVNNETIFKYILLYFFAFLHYSFF